MNAETSPSETQKSTQISTVAGFSKNSCACVVLAATPPTTAKRSRIVESTSPIRPSRSLRSAG
jgi:hypothetical protein